MANVIEKFAPYPKTEQDATAEKIYRYLLVSAQLAFLRWRQISDEQRQLANDDPAYEPATEYLAVVELFVAHWSTLHLLRHVMGLPSGWVHIGTAFDATSPAEGATADDIARDMWIGWEDGGGPAEVLWDWLVEAGFSPDEIQAEFDKATKART